MSAIGEAIAGMFCSIKIFSEIALIGIRGFERYGRQICRAFGGYAEHFAVEEGRGKHNDDDCILRRQGNDSKRSQSSGDSTAELSDSNSVGSRKFGNPGSSQTYRLWFIRLWVWRILVIWNFSGMSPQKPSKSPKNNIGK